MGDRIAILREGGHLAQYDTPREILIHPADEFVAEFVGADRGIKRLSLTTLAELKLLEPNGIKRSSTRAPLQTSVRDALSMILTAGGDALTVVDGQGNVQGLLTLALIEQLLSEESANGSADGSASSVIVQAVPRAPAHGRAHAGGERRMTLGASALAAGPVIPNYSAHSSRCVVENHFFCRRMGQPQLGGRAVAGAAPARTPHCDRRGDRLCDRDVAGTGRAPLSRA